MAITAEPILKSQPDMSKLQGFTGRTVTVTKHQAPRGSVGQLVVPTAPMTLEQILQLQMTIPLQHGAGHYRFEVTDTAGTGEDKWMVRLGPPDPIQENFQMASVTPIGPGPGQPPAGEGVVHLGHGFYYNPELGTLTTPWRRVYNWKQGEQMPEQPSTASAPAATPWWAQPNQPNQPPAGWGGYPATDVGESSRVKVLEAQLAEQQRRQEQAELRAEIRRVEEAAQRRADEAAARMEKLVERLTTTPKGPSEETLALQRRLDEETRRREESERETARRIEMREMNEKFERTVRELSANKTDPMLPMLMQLMTATQQQAQETIKAIQTSTATAAGAAERGTQELVRQLQSSVMTPTALVQLLQSAKGDGAEMARMMLDATKSTMELQKGVYEQLLDVAGQNGQPAWLPLAQEALQRIGAVGAALAQRSAQAQPAPTPAPRQRQVATQQVQQLRPATPPPPRTAEELRTQAAASVEHFQPVASPMNGANGTNGTTAAVAEVTVPLSQVIPPQPVQATAKKRKGKKAKTRAVELPPPAVPQGYTMAQLRELDPEVVREGLADKPDEYLFTVMMPYVVQLRENPPTPEDVARYVLQGRQTCEQMRSAQPPTPLPPAMELLDAEQLEVLVDRLLPGTTDEYRENVIDALEEMMGLDGDDDEDEAQAPTQ